MRLAFDIGTIIVSSFFAKITPNNFKGIVQLTGRSNFSQLLNVIKIQKDSFNSLFFLKGGESKQINYEFS